MPRKVSKSTSSPEPDKAVPDATEQRPTGHARRALRTRAADYVFESLSRAILSGELAPGTILTTQRKLSSQFGVSPLVVRQATHRLEDFGPVLDWAEGQALHAMHAGDSAPAASSSKRPRK